LLLTWVFFFEYIPPNKTVHVWSDIEGYHYPLLSYTHKSLWSGRIPLWDPWIYCGIPFAGNIQAGLFYPPNWLLYIANARMPDHLRNPGNLDPGPTLPVGMRFTSVEILAFLHVWLLFLFTYLWLRERSQHWLPPVLGGMVAALGGYMLSQMNHLGVVCGYAWMPFALWGIEQANRRRDWRSLWKVALGSAMCLFAGYPPTWAAFWVITVLYAATLPWRLRLVPLTLGALAFSIAVGAVQLLPSIEATRLKTPEVAFGSELPFGNGIYASLVLPNYFNQNRTNAGPEVSDGDYLYLGVSALFAIAWLLRRGWYRGVGAALTLAGGVLFVAADPTGLVLRTIEHLRVVPDVLRRYNLFAGVALAGALLAASAVDDFLARPANGKARSWIRWIWMIAAVCWCAWLFWIWPPGGPDFAAGAASGLYVAVLLVLFWAGLWLYRNQRSGLVALALIFVAFAEYKAFGTNRRFNAVDENVDSYWRGDARVGGPTMNGLDTAPYHEMLRHPGYRVALVVGPHSTDMRHYLVPTLQGFDPFLPDQYKAAVEKFGPFKTNRLFDVNPLDEQMLRHFGVRWVMVRKDSPMEATLLEHSSFRRLPPGTSYYVVFEYLGAQPAWRFPGNVRMTRWDPEQRSFRIDSSTGGTFVLVEQFFPGWQARIDGAPVLVQRADGTFQSAVVPAGQHTLEFRYAPSSVRIGAIVSVAAIVAVLWAAWPRRHILGGR
jgi:hypothetical protein